MGDVCLYCSWFIRMSCIFLNCSPFCSKRGRQWFINDLCHKTFLNDPARRTPRETHTAGGRPRRAAMPMSRRRFRTDSSWTAECRLERRRAVSVYVRWRRASASWRRASRAGRPFAGDAAVFPCRKWFSRFSIPTAVDHVITGDGDRMRC